MKQITVRIAKLPDLSSLQNLQVDMEHTIEDQPYPDELGKLGVEYILNNPDQGFYLVAEHSEEVIGALRISYERSVSRNGFFWWIQNVCINENYRGNGIFQKLHDKVVNLAKKNKEVVAIKLHVHTNNRSAIKAYEKAGMKKTPEYPYIFNLK